MTDVTTSSQPRLQSARIAVRLSPVEKALVARAAELEGASLSAFLAKSAESAALATIRRHEGVVLTARDSLAFAEAIANPPKPNERLLAAARRHRELIADEEGPPDEPSAGGHWSRR